MNKKTLREFINFQIEDLNTNHEVYDVVFVDHVYAPTSPKRFLVDLQVVEYHPTSFMNRGAVDTSDHKHSDRIRDQIYRVFCEFKEYAINIKDPEEVDYVFSKL